MRNILQKPLKYVNIYISLFWSRPSFISKDMECLVH